MLINLRNALMTGIWLPYDAEVEYLESTGTQYIDTGANYFADFEITAKMRENVSNVTLKSGAANRLERNSATDPNWRFRSAAAGIYNTTVPITELHTLAWKDGKTYSDGSFLGDWTKNFPPGPMYVFGDTNTQYPAMVYALKLWDANGVLVRDFIPVRKGTVGYLYDRVSRRLFGNAGTGDFVLGPDVVPVEYIESHGTEWIDTGVIGGSSSKVEISASSSNTAQNAGLFGSRNASSVKAFTIWQRVSNTSVRFDFSDDATNRVIANAAWDTSGVNTVIKDGPNNTLNGVAGANNATATFTCEYPFYLFSINTAGTATSNASARVYSCKIWNNSLLVRSFLPVRVGTDATSWEGAMMDVLTRRIYRNAGPGAFTYGNDLKYPIPAE